MSDKKTDQTEIGALWKKEGSTQKFLAGNFDFSKFPEDKWQEFVKTRKIQVVCFNNKFKTKESHPDVRVYLSKPREGTAPAPAATPTPAAKTKAAPTPAPAAPAPEDNEVI